MKGALVTAFSQTVNGVVANTTQEGTLTAAGVGSRTLPARSIEVGTTLRILARGTWSTQATPDFQWRIRIGSLVVCDTGVVTAPATAVGSWSLEAIIVCREAGQAGAVVAAGTVGGAKGTYDMTDQTMAAVQNEVPDQTIARPLDTTVPQTVDMSLRWGAANVKNIVTCTMFIVWAEPPV